MSFVSYRSSISIKFNTIFMSFVNCLDRITKLQCRRYGLSPCHSPVGLQSHLVFRHLFEMFNDRLKHPGDWLSVVFGEPIRTKPFLWGDKKYSQNKYTNKRENEIFCAIEII